MRNFTLLSLFAAAAVSVSAAAPQSIALNKLPEQSVRGMQDIASARREASKLSLKKERRSMQPLRTKGVNRMPAMPSEDDPLITETPAGKNVEYTRTGFGVGYNWLLGVYQQITDGCVLNFVTSDDAKVYFNNPFSLDYMEGWVEGDVKDNTFTFTFPQHVSHEEYNWGTEEDPDVDIYDYYAVVLQYEEDEEGGWFYISEDQTYEMTVDAEGKITPKNPELMIGKACWIDNSAIDEESQPGWYWQIAGDVYSYFTPLTAQLPEVPDGVAYEKWNLLSGITAQDVEVGFYQDKCYLRGLVESFSGVEDAVIVGDVKDGKISFPGGQYLGVMTDYLSTAYFVPGEYVLVEDEEDGIYYDIKVKEELVFDYDKTNKIMSNSDMFAISSVPYRVLYYELVDEPVIRLANPDAVIKDLLAPVISYYSPVSADYAGYLVFGIPMFDSEYNVLDTSKIFWNMIVDEDVYVFSADEYTGLADMYGDDYEMTDVPYGFYDGWNFYGSGYIQDFDIFMEGYDSLAVRTVYKDGDKVIYSPLAWVVKDDGVKGLDSDNVVSSSFIDLQGRTLRNPGSGLYIRVDRMADGSVRYTKTVCR